MGSTKNFSMIWPVTKTTTPKKAVNAAVVATISNPDIVYILSCGKWRGPRRAPALLARGGGVRMINSIRVESDELSLGLVEREVRGKGLCAAFAEPGGYLIWDPSGKRSDISSERVLEILDALSEHAKGERAKGKHAKGEHAERELEAVEVFVSSGYLKEAERAFKAGGYAATFDTKY